MSDPVVASLRSAGMRAVEAEKKGSMFDDAERCLRDLHGTAGEEPFRLFVPGRIEVLGKHTDYAGGPSLLCAVERGMCVVAAARPDPRVRVIDTVSGRLADLTIGPDLDVGEGWEVYPRTVARRVARDFPGASAGADVAIASDLPAAAGLSSSSVLVTGLFVALGRCNRLEEHAGFHDALATKEALADYLGCVENGRPYAPLKVQGLSNPDRGVGTLGGSQDHTAILCSRPGRLVRYSFVPVRALGDVPCPRDHVFAVAVSGVVSEKTAGSLDAYNRASGAVATILHLWNKRTGRTDRSLPALADSGPHAVESLRELLRDSEEPRFTPEDLLRRLEHFFEERGFVRSVFMALERGNLDSFGRFVDRSQQTAERQLGNQVPETMALARSARKLGAVAASAFGAGFGGSVWALIPEGEAAAFVEGWERDYRARFPGPAGRSCFFLTPPGPPLLEL